MEKLFLRITIPIKTLNNYKLILFKDLFKSVGKVFGKGFLKFKSVNQHVASNKKLSEQKLCSLSTDIMLTLFQFTARIL